MLLEESVAKLNDNINRALSRIAPIKIKNLKCNEEPWKKDKTIEHVIDEERKAWLRWKEDSKNSDKKEEWLRKNTLLKKSYGDKKSEHIERSISNCLGHKGKSMWKNVKDAMNWKGGGPPGQLRDKNGKMETKPSKLTEIYHDKMEEKVKNIIEEMEQYEESKEDESIALANMFGETPQNRWEFQPISKTQLLNIIEKLPRKTSYGDDGISYIDIKDSLFYSLDPLLKIINLVMETGHWPSTWKNSIIKPLRKGLEDKFDPV